MGDVTNLNTPSANANRIASRRANASIKHALLDAFDTLGNEAFFVSLGRGSAEDKRCLAMILAKLLPIEVAGALDATLTVRVVTQLGEDIIADVTRVKSLPKDVVTVAASPVEPGPGRIPEGEHSPRLPCGCPLDSGCTGHHTDG